MGVLILVSRLILSHSCQAHLDLEALTLLLQLDIADLRVLFRIITTTNVTIIHQD